MHRLPRAGACCFHLWNVSSIQRLQRSTTLQSFLLCPKSRLSLPSITIRIVRSIRFSNIRLFHWISTFRVYGLLGTVCLPSGPCCWSVPKMSMCQCQKTLEKPQLHTYAYKIFITCCCTAVLKNGIWLDFYRSSSKLLIFFVDVRRIILCAHLSYPEKTMATQL